MRWAVDRLVRVGWLPNTGALSPSVFGVSRSDLVGAPAPDESLAPDCDIWPMHVVLRDLAAGRPVGFAHFNDGECRCLLTGRHRNRDGVEMCSEGVRRGLAGALAALAAESDPRVRERFLVGLPCPRCHGLMADEILRDFPGLAKLPRVPATIFHHTLSWGRPALAAGLRARGGETFLVCSTEQDVPAIERCLGLTCADVLRVDRMRAHDDPDAFGRWCAGIGWGERPEGAPHRALILLCGVMGRPWAVQAFRSDPTSVTLCLGSYFDDIALGRVLRYAAGPAVRCARCLGPFRT